MGYGTPFCIIYRIAKVSAPLPISAQISANVSALALFCTSKNNYRNNMIQL